VKKIAAIAGGRRDFSHLLSASVIFAGRLLLMDLSVCILTRHQPELLPRCVASCVAEMERSGVLSEIIIIDNASWDGSPARIAGLYPIVRLIRNEQNLGFSSANNRGIRVSRGRNVLILNDDAMLQKGSLDVMLSALESDSRVGAVGPKLLNANGSLQRDFTNRRFPRLHSILCDILGLTPLLEGKSWTRDLFTHNRDPEASGDTDYVAGACLLARRAALESVELFDEAFYYLFEDTDLCYRLKRAGWRVIYIAEAEVTHYKSASINELARSNRKVMFFRSLGYFFRKHFRPLENWTYRVVLVFVLISCMPLVWLKSVWRDGMAPKKWGNSLRSSLQAVRSLLVIV
jgi:GT2 family glycosyltransferase